MPMTKRCKLAQKIPRPELSSSAFSAVISAALIKNHGQQLVLDLAKLNLLPELLGLNSVILDPCPR